ncbi:MAG: putative glycoside hydrolase [Candidatus Paceibacteria bacterium]
MEKAPKRWGRWLSAAAAAAGIGTAGFFAFVTPAWDIADSTSGSAVAGVGGAGATASEPVQYGTALHLPTPEPMHAIYMTQCVAGTPALRASLVELIETSALNAVVIDVKDYSGTIGFPTKDLRFKDASLAHCGARDMEALVQSLHEKGIYAIARITVFQDPFYAERHPEEAVQSASRPGEPWEDYKGLSFVDVSSEPFWDYIATLSKEAYSIGFDELNYDYVRYPSDGPIKDAVYMNENKAEALEKFFKYLHDEVKPTGAMLSADLFGYTTVLTDDLGIGQQLERALPYFDYVAPMVYPSHYNKGFAGLADPNSDPYKVVYTSMAEAVRRALAPETVVATLDGEALYRDEVVPAITPTAESPGTATTTKQVATGYYTKPVYDKLKLRPWLQDFDYGKDYRLEDIEGQIHATYDAGLSSWFVWDPANRYENLRQYLSSATTSAVGE